MVDFNIEPNTKGLLFIYDLFLFLLIYLKMQKIFILVHSVYYSDAGLLFNADLIASEWDYPTLQEKYKISAFWTENGKQHYIYRQFAIYMYKRSKKGKMSPSSTFYE